MRTEVELSMSYFYKSFISFSGTHVKNTNCDIGPIEEKVRELFQEASEHYFPQTLQTESNIVSPLVHPEYGGWADPRDQALCLAMTEPLKHESAVYDRLQRARNAIPPRNCSE
jgi:hypothetical protein